MREDRWDKLTNNQVTRWVGSRQLTWEHMAHRKLKQSHVLTQKKIQAHGQQNKSPAKDTNTQLMRIWILFKQNMTTWKHAANEIHKLRATQHKTHGQESARPSKLETTRSHNKTEHGVRVSKPRHEPKLKIWVLGSEHHAPTRNKQMRECRARAHSKPCTRIKTGHDRSVRALSQNPWMTPDRSDRILTGRGNSIYAPPSSPCQLHGLAARDKPLWTLSTTEMASYEPAPGAAQ